MSSRRPRLLVFGVDGLAPAVFGALREAGHLPNLATFAAAADLDATTRCTWPPHTASGWTTLFSGRLPGEHGHYQFMSCHEPASGPRFLERADAGVPFVWDMLQARGWTVGLVNVPMTHPPQGLDGYEFTWPLAPTLRYAHPPGLLSEISDAGGLALPDIAYMYRGDRAYWRQAVGMIHKRTTGVLHLMATRPVDALFVVYPEIDRLCHHYWPSFDCSHPDHAASPAEEVYALAAIGRALDKAFGRIMAEIGDEATVLVASDHGFGPATRAFRVERFLADHGLLAFSADRQAADRSRSRAYLAVAGSFGLNLDQRGDAALETRLRELLLHEARDPEGRPVFLAVLAAARAYPGPATAGAPDLLLVPADPGLVMLPGDGPLWDRSPINGTHRMEGVAIARRLGAARRRAAYVALESVIPPLFDDGFDDLGDPLAALDARGIPLSAWSSRDDAVGFAIPRRLPPLDPGADAEQPAGIESEADAVERLRLMGYL